MISPPSTFDKLLWRVNGLFIALVCIGTFLFMSYAGYNILKETFRTRPTRGIVNVEQDVKERESLSLGSFQQLRNTPVLLSDLVAEQGYSQSYYSKSSSSVRNYFFYNMDTGQEKWLLDNNSSLILTFHEVFVDPELKTEEQTVSALIYEVVTSDIDDDERLTNRDSKDLLYYRLDSSMASTVLHNVDKVLNVKQISRDEALIFYYSDQKNFVVSLDLESGKTKDKKEIARWAVEKEVGLIEH